MSIFCKVAGITFRYDAEQPLRFAAGCEVFRGFGVTDVQNADFEIVIRDTKHHEKIEATKNKFIAQGEELVDFSWSVAQTDDGTDCITVDYDNNPTCHWVQLQLGERGGTLRICRRDVADTEVNPYIFPLFNLMLSRILNRREDFLIHCSLVDYEGVGYLFTAPSGTGKSTMARLWRDTVGATIINDDMLAIRCDANGNAVGYNLPMNYYNDAPKSVKISSLCLICQSAQNYIKPVTGAEAVMRIMTNTIYHPTDKEIISRQLSAVGHVCAGAKVFEVGFRPDGYIVRDILQQKL